MPPAMNPPDAAEGFLSIRGLTKRYGEFTAVEGLDLALRELRRDGITDIFMGRMRYRLVKQGDGPTLTPTPNFLYVPTVAAPGCAVVELASIALCGSSSSRS